MTVDSLTLYAGTAVKLDSSAAHVQGTLFVAGLSERKTLFHLGGLVTLNNKPHQQVWPDAQNYLFVFRHGRTYNTDGRLDDLIRVLECNRFQLVVIVALVLGRRLPQHDRFAHSLKAAVHEKRSDAIEQDLTYPLRFRLSVLCCWQLPFDVYCRSHSCPVLF